MYITNDIQYIGVNDHEVDLFEGQYVVPNGMSYNSYVILDEKIAVMDTVDANFTHQWLDNIQNVLEGRQPDYLVIQHMEMDHAANIANFMKVYPNTTVVSSAKAFLRSASVKKKYVPFSNSSSIRFFNSFAVKVASLLLYVLTTLL